MLGLQVSTLSLILVKWMFFAVKTDAKYHVNLASDNLNARVWLNGWTLPDNGEDLSFADSIQDITVKVLYKSREDGQEHTMDCPNHWYWVRGGENPDLTSYYVALQSLKEMGDHPLPNPEFVDLSNICLYQLQEHSDEKIAVSNNPLTPNARKKKMCCTDQSFNGPNSPKQQKNLVNEAGSESRLEFSKEEKQLASSNEVEDQNLPTESTAPEEATSIDPDDAAILGETQSTPVEQTQPNSYSADDFFRGSKRALRRRSRKSREMAGRRVWNR